MVSTWVQDVDRRYSQTRFYNGAPASEQGERNKDALVKRYLARARSANAAGQSYGGSTGGRSSANGNEGLTVLQQRNASIKDQRETFRQYGSGALGARASIAEARGFRQPATGPSAS